MSDGESIAGREREVTFHTSSALTREQVEEVFNAVYWHGDQQGAKQCKVLDGIDALRATITQQAQELDESERKLVGLCHAHGTALIEIHDLKKELEQAKGNYAIQKAAADDYEQQLAAMTREREAACGELMVSLDDAPIGSLAGKLVTANRVLRSDLAASQARCREMETQRDELNKVCNYHEKLEADMLEKYAQLQATLAAAQARLTEYDRWLQNGVYFTNEEFAKHVADHKATLAAREAEVAESKGSHCKDCCCARSWEALGVTGYTGMSIVEHIERLKAERDAAVQEVNELKRALKGA